MSDFEDSVQKFSDLKESVEELDENIATQAVVNKAKLDEIHCSFQDNKIRAITAEANDLGNVLINQEELDELHSNLENVK